MAVVCFEGPADLPEAELLDAGARDGHAHNLLFVHELRGELDVARLAEAASLMAARHESFRTGFVRGAAGWRRLVYDSSDFALEVIDLTGEPDPEAAARACVLRLHRTAFDRAAPPLLRNLLLRLGPGRDWLVSYCDHVVLDGVTFMTCLSELVTIYGLRCQGLDPGLPPARQPREHVAAVAALLDEVRAAPEPLFPPYPADGFALRPDPGRPGGPDPAGARTFAALGPPEAVDALARARGVSRSSPLLAAMALALREITGRPDVGLTLIRSGRRDPASRGVVGCLAWGDAWSIALAEGEPLSALLARADAFLRDTSPARMLYIPTVEPPTRRIVLNINRYDTALSLPGLMAFPRVDLALDVLMWSAHDLLVQVFPLPGLLQAVVRYRTSFFATATMERFAAALAAALRALTEDADAPVWAPGRLLNGAPGAAQ